MSQIDTHNVESSPMTATPDNPARKPEYPTAYQKADPLNPSARGVEKESVPAARRSKAA